MWPFDGIFSSPPVSFDDDSDDFHIHVMFFIDDDDEKEAEERSEGMNLYVSHYLCYYVSLRLMHLINLEKH